MDRQFPDEMGLQGEPAIPPAPEFGMQLGQMQAQQPQMMGNPGSPGLPPDPLGPNAPVSTDPVLSNLMMSASEKPVNVRKTKAPPPPTIDLVKEIASTQDMLFQDRNTRITRDIALYRQDVSFTPGDFDKRHDTPVVSPFIPNLVDKMANMLSAPEPRIIVNFEDEQSKIASQTKENFGYWSRKQDRLYYGRSGGGSMQWDEFFYLLLHGQVVARVLPDPDDEDYPFAVTLIDPSQCFPIFKGDKHGLTAMIRKYNSSALDIVNSYSMNDPAIEKELKSRMGYAKDADLRAFFNEEGEVIEYWDKFYRAVIWRDITIMDVTLHNYGFVPFVVTHARGEPKGMSVPSGSTALAVDEYGNTGYGSGRGADMAHKTVSIFHHLIHTNRVREVVYTLYLMEMEKALNPPTITYVAPQYMNQDPPPLNLRKRGNNKRVLNFMKVEAVPTSPRPTDASPLMNMIGMDLAEGSLPPVAHGNESGSNVSGFAVESLIAVAKDATLPYTQAFELYLAQVTEMKLKLYRKFILPLFTVRVPSRGSYGFTPMMELSSDIMDGSTDCVEVKLWAMSQQMLPGQIQAAASAVQAGIWPLRKAMEHTGSLDPDRDFQDIISERAIQHPEIMENFIIPRAFIAQGNDQLAEVWNMLVLMPKMMAAMGGMGAPAQAGAPGQPPTAGGGPQPNGQSNPSNRPDTAKSTGGGPQSGNAKRKTGTE